MNHFHKALLGGFLFCSALMTLAEPQREADSADAATVRICDDSGCSQRPANSATFDTPAISADQADPKIAKLTALAESDPKAAFDLGLRFFRGDGVERNPYTAIEWMRSAADRGVTDAQLALGRFYLMGVEEMGSDPAEAESWLTLAAAGGSIEANKLLAQASAAKKDERATYKWREEQRKSGYWWWANNYSYYWYWNRSTWLCHCH